MGVISFETWVKDSHTKYFGKDDYQTSSKPQYPELSISDKVDTDKFIKYLRNHQQGKTDYYTFCTNCAETGVEKWVVYFDVMTCIYFDKAGSKILKEDIPYRDWETDRKSTRLNSSHITRSRMPSSA